jgi:hypothetical protein
MGELVKADINVHHNRPIAGVTVERGNVVANSMVELGSSLRPAIVHGGFQ